jgi:DNA-binding transcriptional LysR family regulator
MDKIARMKAFFEVVESSGYSAAARKTGRSKALLSKYVRELEDDLSVLLINRTTRQFSLTEAGLSFYERGKNILAQFEELQETMSTETGEARGVLRITSSRVLSRTNLAEALAGFSETHPNVKLDVALEERYVDLVEESYDLAIRASKLVDSSLIARKLSDFYVTTVATPKFLEKYGVPEKPYELSNMPCIIDTNYRTKDAWKFQDAAGKELSVNVEIAAQVNTPNLAKQLCLHHVGVVYSPEILVRNELEEGSLVEILSDFHAKDLGIYVLYPQKRHLPLKVRVFLDYIFDWFKKEQGLNPFTH